VAVLDGLGVLDQDLRDAPRQLASISFISFMAR